MSPIRTLALCLIALTTTVAPAAAQREVGNDIAEKLVQLDFSDVELAAVVETIARLTGRNFIYDDRVRGRVTIVSPSKVTVEQAYAVFESVLQVKGFTTVDGPGGVTKIIPVREAKESSIETVRDGRPSPNRDQFVTRLIPLRYINATDITNTLKPLVSKDAAMVAYAPTNTIILTDASSNIRRLLTILESIDVASYREELAVIKVQHADADTLGQQVSEIYGAEISSSSAPAAPRRTSRRSASVPTDTSQLAPGIKVRILTDQRTNSLLVLAPRPQIEDVRELVRKLDVPVTGGGRIHVYYLKHADSEELAQTLNALLSGQRTGPSPGQTGVPGAGAPQALRSVVTELAEGITLTADPGTNSLVIQASKEAYDTLVRVIEQLDIQRPQVLVEALIMEVDVSDGLELGFNFAVKVMGKFEIDLQQATDAVTAGALTGSGLAPIANGVAPFVANASYSPRDPDTTIQNILRAAATDNDTNVISAPHILTSDNEEAEIKIGNNIPIITSRVDSAAGQSNNLASSVNVERQDIGVTLRVTPQISEGDTLRLKIFQEISAVNNSLDTGDPNEVGVALTNRRIENTLVVSDGETVVVGGLLSNDHQDSVTKIPFLGDIPFFGWLFKSTSTDTTKQNLLVFLTPHIIRSPEDLERMTIQKREEFGEAAGSGLELSEKEREEAKQAGLDVAMVRGSNPVRASILNHRERYPIERMKAIESGHPSGEEASTIDGPHAGVRYGLRAGVYSDEDVATRALTGIVDAGYDGTLVSSQVDGTLMYEIRVGPYATLEDAQTAQALLRGAFELDPSVTVLPAELR